MAPNPTNSSNLEKLALEGLSWPSNPEQCSKPHTWFPRCNSSFCMYPGLTCACFSLCSPNLFHRFLSRSPLVFSPLGIYFRLASLNRVTAARSGRTHTHSLTGNQGVSSRRVCRRECLTSLCCRRVGTVINSKLNQPWHTHTHTHTYTERKRQTQREIHGITAVHAVPRNLFTAGLRNGFCRSSVEGTGWL